MQIHVKRQPRSLAVVHKGHALVFRHFPDQVSDRPKCIVEFAPLDAVDPARNSYEPLGRECHGFLGILSVAHAVYLCVITSSAEVSSPRPGETIHRILQVEFYSLNDSTWDQVPLDTNGYPIDIGDGGGAGSGGVEGVDPKIAHPCAAVRKLLSSGSFYYSADFDLTSTLQARGPDAKLGLAPSTIDESFMWNSFLMAELLRFRGRLPAAERDSLDDCGFLTTVIRGFAGTTTVRLAPDVSARLTLISRQSYKRAGTRYLARGVDDDGNVANYVETETILHTPEACMGYTQVRGSVPTFWEQDTNLLSAKITITRSPEAAQPAFSKHFDALGHKFGGVTVVNLLAANKPAENDLATRYHRHLQEYARDARIVDFDFHAEVARGGYAMAANILPRVDRSLREYGWYSYQARHDETEQIGVLRTNCLDCLDRTNMIQQLISRAVLEGFLETSGSSGSSSPDLWVKHNTLWADNGDQLSQIYAGTNALKTSYTRSGKMNLAGALADVTKSVGRMYINNFVDKGRMTTMDVLLGRGDLQVQVELHDPINDFVTAELKRRQHEFSSTRTVRIFAGTFNLNGRMADADLAPWLFAPGVVSDEGVCPDLYLIGFQEIVELNAGQILSASSESLDFWQARVAACLNTRDRYVLLRSNQLVGTALLIFCKQSEVADIRNVEGAAKKTGLGGMAGNKGGIAASFSYAETQFCFITAHLAAGINNIDERHNDYKVLSRGLRFSRGRQIKDHDAVIWLGDFNYRIDLPNDACRQFIKRGELGPLFENDQLNKQMIRGNTFPYYSEMEIKFPPTYKFDNGTNDYDSSEKARAPAWTDRILSRGSSLRQLSYGSAPLLFSDHRPVYATFAGNILIVDQDAKSRLSTELYEQRRAEVGDTAELVNLIDLNETMLTRGLPPPSSENKKWWLDGGQAAKVNVSGPPGFVINHKSDPNPFSLLSLQEPDFVAPALPPRPQQKRIPPVVPRKPVRLSSTSSSSSPPALPPRTNSLSDISWHSQSSLLDDEAGGVAWKPLEPESGN